MCAYLASTKIMDTAMQPTMYIIDFMTTDGIVTTPFKIDISMSLVIQNYVKDMGVEDGKIDLTVFGDRGMSGNDIIQFINIWQYMSGSELATQISPEYFEDKGNMPDKFLPAELCAILAPCEQDVIHHKKWLLAKTTVPESEIDTNKVAVQLCKFMPFLKLANFINYANFLGIDPIIQLFGKLISEYSKLFISIKSVSS